MSQLCRRYLAVLALLLSLGAAVSAQTTGSVVGRVTDEQGGVLPGVAVEARSPALQGSRTAVTDETGNYRLTLLPPGVYEVSFALSGFATDSRQDVTVGLDKDTVLSPVLGVSLSEEITVTTDLPVVNTTTTELGTNLDVRSPRRRCPRDATIHPWSRSPPASPRTPTRKTPASPRSPSMAPPALKTFIT